MAVAADLSSSIWIVYNKEQKLFHEHIPSPGLQELQQIISIIMS